MKKLLWFLLGALPLTAVVSVMPLQADDTQGDQEQIHASPPTTSMGLIHSKGQQPCDGLTVEGVRKILKLPFKLSNNGLSDQGVSGYMEELIELSKDHCIESINRQIAALRPVLLDKIESFRIQGLTLSKDNSEFEGWYVKIIDAMNATWKFEGNTAVAVNVAKPFNITLAHFYTQLDAFINHEHENNTSALNRLKLTSKLIIKSIERTIVTQQFLAYLDERRTHTSKLRSPYEE
ncbi:MAG: hypothetical protein K2X98_06065 [Alphaproteobacteria bacterium]|nr:hypothetical protein [Alphaproteobacteria bacterium]MBX9977789.1 hypothetical protein [Alphaproteobacteria bacterium]